MAEQDVIVIDSDDENGVEPPAKCRRTGSPPPARSLHRKFPMGIDDVFFAADCRKSYMPLVRKVVARHFGQESGEVFESYEVDKAMATIGAEARDHFEAQQTATLSEINECAEVVDNFLDFYNIVRVAIDTIYKWCLRNLEATAFQRVEQVLFRLQSPLEIDRVEAFLELRLLAYGIAEDEMNSVFNHLTFQNCAAILSHYKSSVESKIEFVGELPNMPEGPGIPEEVLPSFAAYNKSQHEAKEEKAIATVEAILPMIKQSNSIMLKFRHIFSTKLSLVERAKVINTFLITTARYGFEGDLKKANPKVTCHLLHQAGLHKLPRLLSDADIGATIYKLVREHK